MKNRWLILVAIVVAAVQIGFLFQMIASRAAILREGREVMLEVRPVDPRDLLRGDYVTLSYNISTIATDLFKERPNGTEWEDRAVVYVRLGADEDGIWQAVAARYDTPPAGDPSENQVDVRGIASTYWPESTMHIVVEYGIERFYVPEGEGRAIEMDLRERPFRMKVAVDAGGTAQIKSFHDGEQMLYEEPLY